MEWYFHCDGKRTVENCMHWGDIFQEWGWNKHIFIQTKTDNVYHHRMSLKNKINKEVFQVKKKSFQMEDI